MKTALLGASLAIALSLGGGAFAASADNAAGLAGRWDASLVGDGPPIAFRLDISGSGDTLKGTFYDGFKPYETTTSASYRDGKLVLKSEHYLTTITATLQNGELVGNTLTQGLGRSINVPFRAVRHVEPAASRETPPAIAGSWEIPLANPSAKGEKAHRLIVQQDGVNVAASILRVDGDTGAYSGRYENGKWVLSHFDSSRPGLIEVTPGKDGTLGIIVHNELLAKYINNDGGEKKSDDKYAEARYPSAQTLTAYRPDVARAKGFAEPANYLTHTTVRDPKEKFTFSFPDLDGKLVSNDDPRFKGKVVLAIVTGTWCPNCHDEAQYLVELDKKYRDQGLAIVALDFEEPEQQDNLVRARAFVKQYGVKYTYLVAGAPSDMWEKVPQAVNLNTWPATLFIGRDGLVKAIHSGFASPASGEFNRQLQQEFTGRIEHLLSEKSAIAESSVEAEAAASIAAN